MDKICVVVVQFCNQCPHYKSKGEKQGYGFRKTSLCTKLNMDPDNGEYRTKIPAVCPLSDAPKEIKGENR